GEADLEADVHHRQVRRALEGDVGDVQAGVFQPFHGFGDAADFPFAADDDVAITQARQNVLDVVQKPQRQQDQRGGHEDDEVHAEAGGQADGGDAPQARGGGEAADGRAALDDGAGAEEADARHDAVGDARGVD